MSTKSFAKIATLAFALLFSAISHAYLPPLTFSGNTVTGDGTWNRPVAGTNGLSGVGTAVAFEVTHLRVNQNDTYSVRSYGTNPLNWDNYSFLYQGSFNPTSQFTNLLAGNDDFPIGNIGSSGFDIALSAGVDYYFVETGFSNTDQGAYDAYVYGRNGGSGFVVGNSVPEPESLALVGLALAGLAVSRRKAKQA